MVEFNNLPSPLKSFFTRVQESSFLFWSVLIVILSVISVAVRFPFDVVPSMILSLFLPGYLIARTVIGKMNWMETIAVSVLVSIVITVFATFFLQTMFNFPFTRETIIEASLLSCVILIGFHYLRGIFGE